MVTSAGVATPYQGNHHARPTERRTAPRRSVSRDERAGVGAPLPDCGDSPTVLRKGRLRSLDNSPIVGIAPRDGEPGRTTHVRFLRPQSRFHPVTLDGALRRGKALIAVT